MLCDVMSFHVVQYYSALRSTTKYYSVLQSTTPVLLYYKVLLQYYKVLLRTTKYYASTTLYYSSTTKYYSVQQSTTPLLLCTTKYYPSTTPYYKVLRQHNSVLLQYYSVLQSTMLVLCTTKYYSSTTLYYASTTPVLQSTTPVLLSTTKYYSVLQSTKKNSSSTTKSYSVLQSTTPVLLCTTKYYSTTQSSTTLYYKVLLQYYKVQLQYYKVLQSITPVLRSTTPVLLCTTKYYSSTTKYYSVLQSTTQYYKVLRQYYSVQQSNTPVLQSTTPYYKVPISTTKYYSVLQSSTLYYKLLRQYYSVLQSAIVQYYKVLLQVVRLPQKVTLELHQILHLSSKMTPMLDPGHIWNVIYNARSNKCHPPTSPNTAPATQNDSHAWSSSHMKRHLQCAEQQVSPSNLILRLPHRMTRMLDRRHIWNVIYNARSNRCHHPTSPNTVPATQNDSHAWSSSHMKRHLQCAEQQVSPSNLTKYCACHAKWFDGFIVLTYETSFTMRGATGVTLKPHQILRLPRKITRQNFKENLQKPVKRHFQCGDDPRMIREWSDHKNANRNPPRNRGYFSSSPRTFSIVKYNMSRPILHSNLHQIHPDAAPATKSDTSPSPNTAPATKRDTSPPNRSGKTKF